MVCRSAVLAGDCSSGWRTSSVSDNDPLLSGDVLSDTTRASAHHLLRRAVSQQTHQQRTYCPTDRRRDTLKCVLLNLATFVSFPHGKKPRTCNTGITKPTVRSFCMYFLFTALIVRAMSEYELILLRPKKKPKMYGMSFAKNTVQNVSAECRRLCI